MCYEPRLTALGEVNWRRLCLLTHSPFLIIPRYEFINIVTGMGSFGSNSPAWHNPGSSVPPPLPFSFSKGESESERVGNSWEPSPHLAGAKLALIFISSCISGNGLAAPPAPLPGRCLLGFQQMPTKAPGVFFHERVLPETKCFESAFSLKKVGRGRAMKLPFLKWWGHPNVTPSPKSFFPPEAGGFLPRHSCRESACSDAPALPIVPLCWYN